MLIMLVLLTLPLWGRLFKEPPQVPVSKNQTGPDWDQDEPWVLNIHGEDDD